MASEIDEMVEAWNAKDRQKAAEAAPWDLIEEMFIFGYPGADEGAAGRSSRAASRCP